VKKRRRGLISELRGCSAQLRAIKGDFVGSLDRTAVEDPGTHGSIGTSGPSEDGEAFHGLIMRSLSSQESLG
jgi:hypothetical protein